MASKPGQPDAVFDPKSLPTFGPGSDLFNIDPGLTITKVNDTHLLVLNRYCVFRPQYLILTLDSYKRQTESLDETDLAAAWNVLQSMQSEHFVIFNCGPKAGCSRLHKHMQMFPKLDDFGLFPDQGYEESAAAPYKYFLARVDGALAERGDTASMLSETHKRLWFEARDMWATSGEDGTGHFPHNVVLTKQWVMVVPRRKCNINGATANAAGMMGTIWVSNQRQIDEFLTLGPANVLSQLGVS